MFVIGTAGHVDHGKSALVKALTGVDPDRLREEKERGLTIELGFAQLDLPGGTRVSIVDVPGHERFIKTMLAGVGGIDLALLVIAADEGVMPQTREHLAIIDLLGIPRGVVVLTKSDLVDAELLATARAEAAEVVGGTTLEDAPIVACSAVTGEGLRELVAAIEGATCGGGGEAGHRAAAAAGGPGFYDGGVRDGGDGDAAGRLAASGAGGGADTGWADGAGARFAAPRGKRGGGAAGNPDGGEP